MCNWTGNACICKDFFNHEQSVLELIHMRGLTDFSASLTNMTWSYVLLEVHRSFWAWNAGFGLHSCAPSPFLQNIGDNKSSCKANFWVSLLPYFFLQLLTFLHFYNSIFFQGPILFLNLTLNFVPCVHPHSLLAKLNEIPINLKFRVLDLSLNQSLARDMCLFLFFESPSMNLLGSLIQHFYLK